MGFIYALLKFVLYSLLAAGIAISIFFLFKYTNSNSYETILASLTSIWPFSTPQQVNNLDGWQEVENSDYKLSVRIPSDWHSNPDGSLSQFPIPINKLKGGIYNHISFSKHMGVMVIGYYNDDLINELAALPDGGSFKGGYSQKTSFIFKKTESGVLKSGNKYVLVEGLEDLNPPVLVSIQAYIHLGGNQILIMSLSDWDDFGIETFKKIVPSVNLK